MKRVLLITYFLFAGAVFAAKSTGYSPSVLYVLEQLRRSTGTMIIMDESGKPLAPKPFIGGSSVGYAGGPGEFFLLIPYFRHQASAEDVALMLKDKSPVVRVMAAYLVLGGDKKLKDISLSSLENDKTPLEVAAGGCIVEELTLAELVQRVRKNPDYLGERWYQQMLTEELKQNEGNSFRSEVRQENGS